MCCEDHLAQEVGIQIAGGNRCRQSGFRHFGYEALSGEVASACKSGEACSLQFRKHLFRGFCLLTGQSRGQSSRMDLLLEHAQTEIDGGRREALLLEIRVGPGDFFEPGLHKRSEFAHLGANGGYGVRLQALKDVKPVVIEASAQSFAIGCRGDSG